LVKPEIIKEGSFIIDVGITRAGSKLTGDVDPRCQEKAAYITTVPGGVGPITIACLVQNVVKCVRLQESN
jgi:methylenetetrahydrofolate dehydrogenase (NADP+)/methenyltetrahydrofolate cyclohydrolase